MRWTPEDFANEIGGFRRQLAGMLRRVRLGVTDGGIWQAIGHALLNSAERETAEIEVWQGIGFYSKPPAGGSSAEAIVSQLGGDGANSPAITSTRDEQTRAASFEQQNDDITDDESALYNLSSRVYVKKNGKIAIRSHGGASSALPTMADLGAVIDYINRQFDTALGHTHKAIVPAQPTLIVPSTIIPPALGNGTCPAASGTDILEAE